MQAALSLPHSVSFYPAAALQSGGVIRILTHATGIDPDGERVLPSESAGEELTSGTQVRGWLPDDTFACNRA